MKKKNSVIRTLTNRSFRANRARNLVAVLAIVLTALMFTSLFVLSQSMVVTLREMDVQQAGYDSHLSSSLLTDEEAEKILAHEAVREFGRTVILATAENEELNGRQVEIRYADDHYAASSFSMATTGTMPAAADEIALDTITLDKLGLPHEVGQTITLKWRRALNSPEEITSTFTLTGYWDGNAAAMASMAWVSEEFIRNECAGVDQEAQRAASQILGMEQLHLELYGDRNLEQAGRQILADVGLPEDLLTPNIAYDSSTKQNNAREIIPMVICAVLVFVSGYLIIHNIFQISVAADIRFYGKLKTLGTSTRQLKRMIYGQANRLCLLGIPLGLLLGYLAGVVLVPLVISTDGFEASISVNPLVFAGSAFFAWVTVLISCMKPAKIAGKVSPMEALRYTEGENLKLGETKRSRNRAGVAGMAWANLGRNKKRTFTVICSITLGFLLLTVIYAKNASFDPDKYMSWKMISDFELKDSSIATNFSMYDPHGATITPDLVGRVEELDGLEHTGRLYSQVIRHRIGAAALANIEAYYQGGRLDYIEAEDPELAESYRDMTSSGECAAIVYGVDGLILDTFSESGYMIEGSFDREKFLSGGYCLVGAAEGAEEMEKETQPTYAVGDSVEIDGREYTVMGIVAALPPITEGVSSVDAIFLSFYFPADKFREMYPENTMRKFFFDVREDVRPQAEEMLSAYKQTVDRGLAYTSKAILEERYADQTRSTTVMGFSVSLIIAFVGILNFVNSMVTAIVSRKKEFAMIQSVGMTKRQLRSMMMEEGLYYAAAALALSYILSIPAVGILVRAMVSADWTATFRFTILPLAVCTPVLLVFAVLVPYLCFKNVERQSIVERLRAAD